MNSTHLHRKSSTLHLQSTFADSCLISPPTIGQAHMLAITPSRTAGYLDAIKNLAPLIEEHRGSFDRDRRLPDVVFRALAEAGLFRLWLPSTMGGPELSPTEFMQVVEAASAMDGS